MPGLVPGIHVLGAAYTWMAGSSPAMTMWKRRGPQNARATPKYKATRTGASSGSLEVLGGLTKPYVSFIGGKFFRLMLSIVSIVSSAVTLPCPGMGPVWRSYPLEIFVLKRRSGRRRRP